MKSYKVGKIMNNGLFNLAKALKIKPKMLYVIFGLIVVLLIVLGLSLGKRKEGFATVTEAKKPLAKIVDNMMAAINNTGLSIDQKKAAVELVNLWWGFKMTYLVAQGGKDLKTYDTSNNNKIYQLKDEFLGTIDPATSKVFPQYVDDNIETPMTVFFRKYNLRDLTARPGITIALLISYYNKIEEMINKLSLTEPVHAAALQKAFNEMRAYGDEFAAYILKNPIPVGNTMAFLMNILGQGSSSNGTVWLNSGGGGGYGASASAIAAGTSAAGTSAAGGGGVYGASAAGASTSVAGTSVAGASAVGASAAGVTHSNIPPGSQDLYMLKSQMLPPSNPAGANSTYDDSRRSGSKDSNNGRDSFDKFNGDVNNNKGGDHDRGDNKRGDRDDNKRGDHDRDDKRGGAGAYNSEFGPGPSYNNINQAPVPPCPPCERCPEPSFDCKRVPNYNSASVNQYLPQPVLADFSQFGM
jgi:hypothetical protein